MFTKITLENFRSFDHIELDLTEKGNTAKHLAILYGENGAGKSNLMSAFVLLPELTRTMDARAAYERILAQGAIFQDENMEKEMREHIRQRLRDMSAIIKDYQMADCENPNID